MPWEAFSLSTSRSSSVRVATFPESNLSILDAKYGMNPMQLLVTGGLQRGRSAFTYPPNGATKRPRPHDPLSLTTSGISWRLFHPRHLDQSVSHRDYIGYVELHLTIHPRRFNPSPSPAAAPAGFAGAVGSQTHHPDAGVPRFSTPPDVSESGAGI
jgi:hypothetical protein